MKTPSPVKRKPASRATWDLLCLLASYEAYGTGAGSAGCLRRLTPGAAR